MILISNSRMENSHRNINIMFHATSTEQHKRTKIATSVLISCNMGQSVRFFLHARRSNPSITVLNLFNTHTVCSGF